MSERNKVSINVSGGSLKSPKVIVGVPDSGLVGTIACSYLVEQLKLEQIGYIDAEAMPPVLVVHESKPDYPVHIFGGGGVAVVLSEVPLPPRLSVEVAKDLVSWAKSQRAEMMVGVTGLPSRKREESPDEKPVVLGVANDETILKKMKAFGVAPFEDGMISGLHASLLKQCMAKGQSGLVLMVESLLQFPDPLAASGTVETLGGLLSVKVDVKPLLKQSEEIRLRLRQLMQQTQQAEQQQLPSKPAGVYG
ncbi:MAG: PAC2 family protein [Thaumarchaeota archaeon]|nr:PAC2 family protein [Nitrososphaerota archaeon]